MDTMAQRLAEAVQQHRAGRLAQAEALYRAILAEAPNEPGALHLLGLIAYQNRHFAEAAELIQRALAIHGPEPVFHSNLAAVFLELGRLDDTIAHARQALALEPNLPDAHNNLGVALMRQGHLDQAEAAFHATLQLRPGHVDARCNLAAILQRQGRLPEAQAYLEQAVRLAPNHAGAQNALGGVLIAGDQYEPAVEHLRRAVQLAPAFAEAHSNLGLALRELGAIDEAAACFRESLRLNPRYPGGHNNLAYLLEYQGRFEAARDEFLAALAIDPDNTRALAGLVQLATTGHHRLEQVQLDRLHALAARRDLPLDERARVDFSLGRALDKAGAYDEAFEHFRQGNELRRKYVRGRGTAFDPVAHRRYMDRLIAAYSPSFFERVCGIGVASEVPIFVVGIMRSGTTLAEQILASHPQVHGAGELRELGRLTTQLAQRLGAPEEYPECVTRLDAAAARALSEEYLHKLCKHAGGAARVVDKMPFNFLHLGLIATLFPQARLIHCVRDPIDTCLSCYFHNFGEPHGFTLDLAHLGAYYREYQRLMAHWRAVLPLPIFELRYEELTAEPEAVCRRLVEFCGLAWDERCLRFHETDRPVRTPSMVQVRQPIYRGAVGRWKRYEKHLGPLIEALQAPATLLR
jgi:Flp pilus assembly protein TadD